MWRGRLAGGRGKIAWLERVASLARPNRCEEQRGIRGDEADRGGELSAVERLGEESKP